MVNGRPDYQTRSTCRCLRVALRELTLARNVALGKPALADMLRLKTCGWPPPLTSCRDPPLMALVRDGVEVARWL